MKRTYEDLVQDGTVTELPPPTVAKAIAPPPQPPQRWPAVLTTGRFEDDNPPGTPR